MTTNNTATLDPCPFCRAEKNIDIGWFNPAAKTPLDKPKAHTEANATFFFVQCWSCGAHGPSMRTKEEAISTWNQGAK